MTGLVDLVFGFGSLVNNRTLPSRPLATKKASISGFRRDWCVLYVENGYRFGGLGLVRDSTANAPIRGVAIRFTGRDLEDIYEREKKYDRIIVECVDQYNLDRPEKALSFAAPPVADAFIPMSYLATVAEGFEEHYGKDGIEEFLLTTEFSDRKVFDDREKPVYRRTHASGRTYGAVISSLKHRVEVIRPNHVSRGRVSGHAA